MEHYLTRKIKNVIKCNNIWFNEGFDNAKEKKVYFGKWVKHRIKFEIYYYYLIQQKGAIQE